MGKRSLLNRAKTSEFQKGIFDNVYITAVDTEDRKGKNGPINKMIYIKFAQLNDAGKKVAESELSWWKPDVTSEYFKVNLQEICLQLHNIVEVFLGKDKAFDAFQTVFDVIEIEDHKELNDKKWKQRELTKIITELKVSFIAIITPYVNNSEAPLRMKLSTNFKGEDIEIPKYGAFVESMAVEKTELKFTANELKTHSKSGNVGGNATAASSTNTSATI